MKSHVVDKEQKYHYRKVRIESCMEPSTASGSQLTLNLSGLTPFNPQDDAAAQASKVEEQLDARITDVVVVRDATGRDAPAWFCMVQLYTHPGRPRPSGISGSRHGSM